MSITINQGIAIESPNTALINGTVSNPASVTGIELFDGSHDVGPATVNPDGTWTFDASFDQASLFRAVATDTSGTTQTSDTLEVFTDVPLPGQILSLHLFGGGDEGGFVFAARGRALYTVDVKTDPNDTSAELTGQGGPGIAYVAGTTGKETIENFRVHGPRHDTLNLADGTLQSLADVLHHTTMSGGNATIHFDSTTSVTLQNVTKQQIAANRQDFVFGGGGLAG